MALSDQWRKAAKSCDSANCVEVHRVDAMSLNEQWRKATESNNNGACAEVRRVDDEVQVRDSKLGKASPILSFTTKEWDAFLDGANKGEFNLS